MRARNITIHVVPGRHLRSLNRARRRPAELGQARREKLAGSLVWEMRRKLIAIKASVVELVVNGGRKKRRYNDFVLACGIRDALGTQPVYTPSHAALFDLHRQIGRSVAKDATSILGAVTDTLSTAMQRHMEWSVSSAGYLLNLSQRPWLMVRITFFHIKNGSEYPDRTGAVFANHEEAMAHASILAAELKQDVDWEGFVICVTDERERLVAHVQAG